MNNRIVVVTRSIRKFHQHRKSTQTPFQFQRHSSSSSNATSIPSAGQPRKFKVTLDNETLYIGKELAIVLGWNPDSQVEGVALSLHGWDPTYFTITRKGTDSEWLSRGTIESSTNPIVLGILKRLG